jgi:glycosyltransferase involved in cell wall biosynthesis
MESAPRPRVSFGVPVYNEERSIRRCLDSILAQEFSDFEIVVSDNASTDRMPEILAGYAARDARVRVFRNEVNLGMIANFNRAFHLSRGAYFRWVGGDDWLEAPYASRCVAALEADLGAIAATTGFALHREDGTPLSESFQGERLESERPSRRFARMLWFFHAGATKYEPLYSLIRREVLERSGLIRPIVYNDYMLMAELSLAGRFTHVPDVLFHRGWRVPASRQAVYVKIMHGSGTKSANPFTEMVQVLFSIVREAQLSTRERARCRAIALRYCARELYRLCCVDLARLRRERLGLTRARLRCFLDRCGSAGGAGGSARAAQPLPESGDAAPESTNEIASERTSTTALP